MTTTVAASLAVSAGLAVPAVRAIRNPTRCQRADQSLGTSVNCPAGKKVVGGDGSATLFPAGSQLRLATEDTWRVAVRHTNELRLRVRSRAQLQPLRNLCDG